LTFRESGSNIAGTFLKRVKFMLLNEKFLQKGIVLLAFGTFANMLWGSAGPIIKLGYELLEIAADDTSSQIVFAGIRFFIAGIFAIILGSIINGGLLLPSRQALPKIAVLSLFQTIIQYFIFYIACANAAGYKVSILSSTSSFMSILIASLVFRQEKMSFKKILGCALGFSGVLLINLKSLSGFDLDMTLMGEGFVLIATVSFSFSNALTKHYSKSENPVMLCGWQFVLGGAVLFLLGLAGGGHLVFSSPIDLLTILYLAMVSAVAFSLTSLLMKYNPVSKVSIYAFINPMFGVVLSFLLLGESSQSFGLRGVLALLLVCAGIFTVNYSKENKAS